MEKEVREIVDTLKAELKDTAETIDYVKMGVCVFFGTALAEAVILPLAAKVFSVFM